MARAGSVANVYWLVVNAAHPELSPQAAMELGELMERCAAEIGGLTDSEGHSMHDPMLANHPQRCEEQAREAYTVAARSGHPTYAPLAVQRLGQA
jgi:hypothetical protein